MTTRRKSKKVEKLNLIPILDAIFIFIFFLLMSAQFIDIYQVGSDAPVTSTLTQEQEDKKKPLNLSLVITKNYILVKGGMDSRVIKKIGMTNGDYEINELKETLMSLKEKHPKESTVIFKPSSNVKYEKIVALMDTVKEFHKKVGNRVAKKDLFKKIVFETI